MKYLLDYTEIKEVKNYSINEDDANVDTNKTIDAIISILTNNVKDTADLATKIEFVHNTIWGPSFETCIAIIYDQIIKHFEIRNYAVKTGIAITLELNGIKFHPTDEDWKSGRLSLQFYPHTKIGGTKDDGYIVDIILEYDMGERICRFNTDKNEFITYAYNDEEK